MYVIVEFTTTSEFEALPWVWLTDDGNAAYWPDKDVRRAIRERSKPEPQWKKYPVRILAKTDNYDKAIRKAKKASDGQDNLLTTDDENLGKRRRQPSSRFLESEAGEPPRRKSKWNLPKFPELSSGTTKTAATGTPTLAATGTPKPAATGTPKPATTGTPEPTATGTPEPAATGTPEPAATGTPKPAVTGTLESADTGTPEPAATSTPKRPATGTATTAATVTGDNAAMRTPTTPARPHPQASERAMIVIRSLEEVKGFVKQNNTILHKLLRRNSVENVATDITEKFNFPLDTHDAIQDVEDALADRHVFKSLINRLVSLGGRGEAVRRMMGFLLTNSIAKEFNWKGRGGKHPFGQLKLAKAVLEAGRKHGVHDESINEDKIKTWLKYSKDREGGRKNRIQKRSRGALDGLDSSNEEEDPKEKEGQPQGLMRNHLGGVVHFGGGMPLSSIAMNMSSNIHDDDSDSDI